MVSQNQTEKWMNGVNHTHTHIIREGWKPHHQSQENHLPVLSVRKLVRDTMLALVLKGLDQNWFNQETVHYVKRLLRRRTESGG